MAAPERRSTRNLATPIFAVLTLATLGVIAYHNSFSGPFVFDDEPSIVNNPTLSSLLRAWWPPMQDGLTVSGRPVLNFSFAVNHALGGLAPWGFHLGNLLIHVAASMTLYGLVRRTLRGSKLGATYGEKANAIALLVAALWLVHPLQTESVTYVVQRAESLAGLFLLLTLWCFARATESDAKHQWRLGAVLACLLGMATKEVVVVAPVLVALYDRTFVSDSWREVWARRGRFHLGLATTWIVLLGLVLATGGRGGTAGFDAGVSAAAYALTQIKAIAQYLRLSVWPAPLVLDYGRAVTSDWRDAILPALLLLPLGVASLWGAWRGRPAGFCGFFFFAVLAPSSSIVPVATQTMAEHRMYLPLAAAITLAVAPVQLRYGRKATLIFAVFAVALTVVTVNRNRDYATAIGLYEDTVAKCPGNARAMALLADYYLRSGRVAEARAQLERSLAVEPGVPEVLNNLGNVWQRLGDPVQAATHFKAALAVRPGDAAIRNNLGNAFLHAGCTEEGIAELETAARLQPGAPRPLLNLANALAQCGRFSEAATRFAELTQKHPNNAEAHRNYGNVLLTLGRTEEAILQLAAAVQLQPDDADGRNRLGFVLARSGRLSEALAQFEAALAINPAHASARQNAQLARRKLGIE